MAITIKQLATPVVFTNTAGGGADEVQAPANNPSDVAFPLVGDLGGMVVAAWYSPLDNIADLPKITHIECQPNGNRVSLIAQGHPGNPDARVRISIYAAVDA